MTEGEVEAAEQFLAYAAGADEDTCLSWVGKTVPTLRELGR